MLIRASVEDDLVRGRLASLELDGPPIVGEIVMTYRSQAAISPLVREFINFVRSELDAKPDAGSAANVFPGRRQRRVVPTSRSTRRRDT